MFATRRRGAFHGLALAACLLLVTLVSGCIRSKEFWQSTMKGPGTVTMGGEFQSRGLKPPLVLSAKDITNSMAATITNGTTLVSYAENLQAQATLVARFFEQSLKETEHLLSAPLAPPHVYLLRLPNERRTIRFSMSFPETEEALPWLMVLTNNAPLTPATSASGADSSAASVAAPVADQAALWADLRELPFHIFVFAHEAFEMQLINPRDLLVMGDITAQRSFLKFTFEHHTRWFRDGLADFCGLKARESFRRQLLEAGVKPGAMHFPESSMQPFSDLARSKDKLFRWDQNSKANYYEAATALFLLIEQRAGPDAIRALIQELPNIKFPDGKALLKMVRQKTGLELRRIARTFEFPELGLETKTDANGQLEIKSIVPESWAARANLLPADILLEANAHSLVDLLSLELEIFQAIDNHQTLSLTFLRGGAHRTTEALPLPSRKPNRTERRSLENATGSTSKQ